MSFLVGVPGKLKTLLDRLTATRAGFLDYIDTLNTRWDATSKTDFGTLVSNVATLISRLTADRASNLDNVGYLFTQRKYDQAMTGTTLNITLDSAVSNMSKADIYVTWSVDNAGPNIPYSTGSFVFDLRPFFVRARLTSTSNVRIERSATGSPAVNLTVNVEVSEWKTS